MKLKTWQKNVLCFLGALACFAYMAFRYHFMHGREVNFLVRIEGILSYISLFVLGVYLFFKPFFDD